MGTLDVSTALVNAALSYAARGWRVLPVHTTHPDGRCTCGRGSCDSPGKHPRLRDWPRVATTDAAVIRRWWSPVHLSNVGIATGTGLLVLDVDGDAGDESIAVLERQHGRLCDTPRSITGGGGHYLFGVATTVPNKVGIAPGLDIRGDGGFIVAPPSRHASGRCYAWDLAAHPDETPLAPAPRWLLDLIATASHRPASTAGGVELRLEHGSRNDGLFRLVCGWRRQGFGRPAIRAMLDAADHHHCAPSLGDPRELDRIAESAAMYPPGAGDDGDGVTDVLLARALGLRA